MQRDWKQFCANRIEGMRRQQAGPGESERLEFLTIADDENQSREPQTILELERGFALIRRRVSSEAQDEEILIAVNQIPEPEIVPQVNLLRLGQRVFTVNAYTEPQGADQFWRFSCVPRTISF